MRGDCKVTVIMSNYNQEKYVSCAIESVLNQNVDFAFQLLITDDFSTKDKSVEIIKQYEAKFPEKIKVLYNQENGGYLKNVLRAKAITKTPYFCLLDADDCWTDMDYLQSAVNFLDSHPDYVIYSRNVVCQAEDGSEHLFVPQNISSSDFTLDDYFKRSICMTQTTGTFFRNVIFINGVPSIMEKAVGTISERSFEGDFDRYLMHLKYGKAHYDPKPSGIYRLLTSGIWSRLTEFEKNIIQAQCYLDYNAYFEDKYNAFFFYEAYKNLSLCVVALNELNQDFAFADYIKEMFFNVASSCHKNRELISAFNDAGAKGKKIKLKYRIMLFVYNKIRKRLQKKRLV